MDGYGVPAGGAADSLGLWARVLVVPAFPVAAIASVATTVRDASDNHHLGRRFIGSWYLLNTAPCRFHDLPAPATLGLVVGNRRSSDDGWLSRATGTFSPWTGLPCCA